MDLEPVPIEHTCLGCKRYFLYQEVLPIETITVEFKNYAIPIKEKLFKSVLLKTIVAFMNGKGGTIFIGVDDTTGQVLGITLGRKEMDEFRLVVKHMLEKVIPAVDLVKEEEVFVEFIPVLEGKEKNFYGKYVIKFIVRQGDPSKLYCVSEKIQSSDRKQIEVISAFRRHNLGGIEELKGIKVIQEIYEKARNPYKPYETFHKNCNPHPISPAIVERPKVEVISRIFADEDSSDSSRNPQSSRKRSLSQGSANETIIDKIQELNTTVVYKKESPYEKKAKKENKNPFKMADEAGCMVYFENVKDVSILKMINYLKNSTPAKFALQIDHENGIICTKMQNKQDRDGLIEYMGRDPYKRLMNEFGLNGKVNILKTLSHKSTRMDSVSQEKQTLQMPIPDIKPSLYRLLFCNYVKNLEVSVQNYLKNSININIKRKMSKSKDGIELIFEHKKDMNAVYELCLNPPHNRLLGQFWAKGAIKIQKFERIIADKFSSGKQEQKTPQKKIKLEINNADLPELMNLIDKIDEEKPQKSFEFRTAQLIASSLEPIEVSKLSNYLVNNMFYNIQKKIFASKDRYYIRIVFNNTEDCKNFFNFCTTDPHKQNLAQFSGSKAFRIGVPGENLIISPYSDSIKDDLKKLIIKVLGMTAIKKSSIKEVNGVKVWSLTPVDPSKLFECYEKLEGIMRKQGFFINNEWHRFRVFLDYLCMVQ